MKNEFYPSINGIYFKNFDIVEDDNGIKHIRGDIYIASENRCIGHYNPVFQTEHSKTTQYFLRIDDEYQWIYQSEDKYESLFNKYAVPMSEYDCPVGLKELLSDLEIVTYLHSFMVQIRPNSDFESIGIVGLINGHDTTPVIKVVQIKDGHVRSNLQIIDFINENIQSINLDQNYPVVVFKCQQDFSIKCSYGKIIETVEGCTA